MERNVDNTETAALSTPQMDETYYKPSGDCFLLVGGAVFRVHSYLLRQDSSIFNDMFSLPAPKDNEQQGTSASDPIILHDNADDFRALCWALYALPAEIHAQNDCDKIDTPILISLARICKKYQFSTTEKWVLSLFDAHINHPLTFPFHFRSLASPCRFADYLTDNFEAILDLSVLCDHQRLTEHIVSKWLEKVKGDEADIAHALATAERLGLRDFQGSLYYEQLLKMSTQLPRGSLDRSSQPKALQLTLTLDQQRKLYSGFWSLSMEWANFVASTTGDEFTCGWSQCVTAWNWILYPGERSNPVGMYNYLKELERIVESMSSDDESSICSYCYEKKLGMLRNTQKEWKARLADHFLGVKE